MVNLTYIINFSFVWNFSEVYTERNTPKNQTDCFCSHEIPFYEWNHNINLPFSFFYLHFLFDSSILS